MSQFALITGTSGSIGSAIASKFKSEGFNICGIDIVDNKNNYIDLPIKVDLNEFVINPEVQCNLLLKIKEWVNENSIQALINNAAYQYICNKHPIALCEINKSYNVNVLAPYLLISNLAKIMASKTGSVVNISSIHSRLTKPGFFAYSTTKAALSALTRSLALDYENQFRINCIEPASVLTPMLKDGFSNSPEKMQLLESYHPQKRIATPEEIAELVFLISSNKVRFMHGACIDISGGIAGRLHDPE